MNTEQLIAIDFHTHAEVSCCQGHDHFGDEFDRAADKYFGSDRRPDNECTSPAITMVTWDMCKSGEVVRVPTASKRPTSKTKPVI